MEMNMEMQQEPERSKWEYCSGAITSMNNERDDQDIATCEVDWKAPKNSLCRPYHKCELPHGHEGKHVCGCGWTRRRLKRDEPDAV